MNLFALLLLANVTLAVYSIGSLWARTYPIPGLDCVTVAVSSSSVPLHYWAATLVASGTL